jgi:hypothetical protein
VARILTITLILLSFTVQAGSVEECSTNSKLGFFGRIKQTLGNQINKIKRHNQTKERNLKIMKENDKTSYVGQYHTVSSCGVFAYSDPFRGGSQTKVVANKVNKSPGSDLVNFNIKNRKGTMSGRAACLNQKMNTITDVGSTRLRKFDKGAGLILMTQSAIGLYNHAKHICNKKDIDYYDKDFRVEPFFDGYGGLFNGKRRFPGIGTFGPSKAENNVNTLCGKLRGNIMVRTTDNSHICMGYSKNGTDEITVYVNPKNTIYTQRVILRKESAFHKYSVPSCKAQQWLDTRWVK